MPTQAAACQTCGHPVASGARFCQNCGADVSQEQGMLATMSLAATPPPRKTSHEAVLDLLREETLGDYEILGELGRGGMATVYLAHDIALDRKVAVKVMAPALMDEGLAERFRREARTAAALNHPHIIPIYAVRERAPLLFFVMKFIPGQSLDPILKTLGKFPIPMAQVILAQAAGALGYAHRRGVIHRDVKPANIMLDEEGWVVMTDFGIAKVSSATGLTMTGVTVGTPAYMSPEQCLGKEVTGASDQYSLGVVAYEMLTGAKPFQASTAMAMMYAHFNEEPKPLGELRPDLPPELAAGVMRMISKDPEKRWPRIDDVFVAPSLAHDDPTRQQLVSLALTSPNATIASRISTPTSPVPPARRGSATRTTAAPPPTEPMTPTPLPAAPTQPVRRETTPVKPRRTAPAGPRETGQVGHPARRPAWIPWAGAAALAGLVLTMLVVRSSKEPSSEPGRPGDSAAIETGGPITDGGQTETGGPKPVDSVRPPTDPSAGETGAPPPPPPETARAGIARIQLEPARLDLEVGQSERLTPTLFAAGGAPINDGRNVVWTTSARAIATVDQEGSVQAVRAGRATITAQVEGKSARVQITVRTARDPTGPTPPAGPAAVASIILTPESATVAVGRTLALGLLVRDAQGLPVSGRPVTWTTSTPAVSVSASGQVQGRSPGTAVVTAAVGGRSAQATITVTPVPVAVVKVTGPAGPLRPGETVQLAATAYDAAGSPLDDREAAWTSSDRRVASVTPAGLVAGQGTGTATITGTIAGQSASVAVTVASSPADAAAEQARATQEITRQLDAFVEAINSRDLARLKAVYPGMPASFEERWRTMMQDPRLKRLQASRGPLPAVKVEQNTASVPFTVTVRPEYAGAAATSFAIPYLAEFERDGERWRLRQLQPVRGGN